MGESGGQARATSGQQEARPPCVPRPWQEPSLGDLLGPGTARPGGGATRTRRPGIPWGSGPRGCRGSGGGPGGAFARGRGRLAGPPGGTWTRAPFLLAVEGRVATRAAPTGLVVAPCGEGSRSAAGGGGQTGGLVTVGGLVIVGLEVAVLVVVEEVPGGGHLGRNALDHL